MSKTLHEVVMGKVLEFKFKTTVEPNMLLLPRSAGYVKSFAEALSQEVPEAGSAPLIFHRLWNENAQCWYECGDYMLEVVVSDTDDDMCVDYSREAVRQDVEPKAPQIIH